MRTLKESILYYLQEYNNDEDLLISQLSKLIDQEGDQACAKIFKILTHIEFSDQKARVYWELVIKHHQQLKEVLDRNVSIVTAICDYFCTIDVSLRNPKIIEIPVYEENAKYLQYDFLTGLHTRSYFEEILEKELGSARRYSIDTSLIFFDLDDFKKINDHYGHQTGDFILEKVSETIMNKQRKGDVSARYGGEEIVMILPHTNKVQAYIFAERIREAIEKSSFVYEDKKINITISGGIGSFPEDGNEGKALLKAADDALYRAKKSGKNEIIAFSDEKRIYLRIEFVRAVTMIGMDDQRLPELKINSKNLSKNGILFEHSESIDPGTKVELKVSIDDSHDPITINGIVVRTEAQDNNKFDIGVLFFNMENNTKNEISKYIIRQLNKN